MAYIKDLKSFTVLALATLIPALAHAQAQAPSMEAVKSAQNAADPAKSPIDVLRDPKTGATAFVDRSGKGAILCSWGIMLAVQEVGRACFSGKDQLFQAELRNSILRTDKFIIDNSSEHFSQAQVDARKAATVAQFHRTGDVCKSQVVAMYTAFRDRGPEAIRAGTDDMLSIPREPVINPCF